MAALLHGKWLFRKTVLLHICRALEVKRPHNVLGVGPAFVGSLELDEIKGRRSFAERCQNGVRLTTMMRLVVKEM